QGLAGRAGGRMRAPRLRAAGMVGARLEPGDEVLSRTRRPSDGRMDGVPAHRRAAEGAGRRASGGLVPPLTDPRRGQRSAPSWAAQYRGGARNSSTSSSTPRTPTGTPSSGRADGPAAYQPMPSINTAMTTAGERAHW